MNIPAKGGKMDRSSHLILHLTPKTEVEKGIPVMSRGEGVHVFDSEGQKYIDLVAGVTRPIHLGYGNSELAQAIYDQMMALAYFTPMMFANEPAIRLAEVLAEITPGAINCGRGLIVCTSPFKRRPPMHIKFFS
jgi:adenosylmethionine-8-amino-7-oxononanoate aminotransferase